MSEWQTQGEVLTGEVTNDRHRGCGAQWPLAVPHSNTGLEETFELRPHQRMRPEKYTRKWRICLKHAGTPLVRKSKRDYSQEPDAVEGEFCGDDVFGARKGKARSMSMLWWTASGGPSEARSDLTNFRFALSLSKSHPPRPPPARPPHPRRKK